MASRKLRGLTSGLLIACELLALSTLVLVTRCANFREVFLGGEIYFTDADCYARMSRARICFEHPGTILRQHAFENYPTETTPHTTAPFDYLIVALAAGLKPFTAQPLNWAGAIVSPILGLLGALFFWIWLQEFRWRDRVAPLLLYAASPILVHGTQLGRPDHQSFLIFLLTVALGAEWRFRNNSSIRCSILAGFSWGLALWTSLYEPLALFLIVLFVVVIREGKGAFSKSRRVEWLIVVFVFLLFLPVERRFPEPPLWSQNSVAANWAGTIGELSHVRMADPIWLRWAGGFLFALPVLFWFALRKRFDPLFAILLLATYVFTLFQARWSYFFVLVLAISLPALFYKISFRWLTFMIAMISFLPILQDWDERLWPNESQIAVRAEHRGENIALRNVAANMTSGKEMPFLAPWWLSPAIAYWSSQPGVAGSSHESLGGINDSARFFATSDANAAGDILRKDHVAFVVAYNSDRVLANSDAILAWSPNQNSLAQVLDRMPSRAPEFLRLVFQNSDFKLFRVENFAQNLATPRENR